MAQDTKIRKILFVKVSAIGDIVRAFPALITVRRAFPDAHIAFMIGREYVELIEFCPYIQEIVPYDRRRNFQDFGGYMRFIRDMRKKKFDLVLNLQNTSRFDLMAKMIGARSHTRIVTLKNPMDGVSGVYEVLKTVGIENDHPRFEFWATEEDCEFADRFLKDAGVVQGDRLVGLNPGGNWKTKQWPSKNYAALGDTLHAAGMKTIVMGGPADLDRANEIAALMKQPPIIAAGQTTLRQAACLIHRCAGFVSNDSGLMHIAALIDVPTVGIFGSTNPAFDGPVGEGSRAIYKAVECSPCYKQECNLDDDRIYCLSSVRPEEVLSILKQSM